MNGNLRKSQLRYERSEQKINPMDGMANLADVMLVMACGLMISLISSWNVDIGAGPQKPIQPSPSAQVQQVEGIEDSGINETDATSGYEEMGKVFRDPETGQLYMVANPE